MGRKATTGRSTIGTSGVLLAAGVLGALAIPAAGSAQDEAGARAAVDRIFEGMRTADADMVRSVFAADARFASVSGEAGTAAVQVQSVNGWLDAVGSSDGRWDEQIYDVAVQVDGIMASVWAPYTFYLDGEISHCGINSIELLHDGAWKVTQLSDTRRREDCPDPLGSQD